MRDMNNKQKARVTELWDQLADFGANEYDAAARHLMTSICGLINAQNAVWCGSVRVADDPKDPLKGWRVPAFIKLQHNPPPGHDATKKLQGLWNRRKMDPSFLAGVKNIGMHRCWSFRNVLSPKWFESDFYNLHFKTHGIYDLVYVSFPLNHDCESVFGFERKIPRREFSPAEKELLSFSMRGIKWFHRQLMLGHGLMATTSPILPSERKILGVLLTGASEKEIAHHLGLAPGTTHNHVTSILRKFGVQSRSGLMGLWLGVR
jgi:DNA-binding CsgD family transcriptional regulator